MSQGLPPDDRTTQRKSSIVCELKSPKHESNQKIKRQWDNNDLKGTGARVVSLFNTSIAVKISSLTLFGFEIYFMCMSICLHVCLGTMCPLIKSLNNIC